MRNVDPCFGKEVQAQNKALADVSFIRFQNFVKHHNSLAHIKNSLLIWFWLSRFQGGMPLSACGNQNPEEPMGMKMTYFD